MRSGGGMFADAHSPDHRARTALYHPAMWILGIGAGLSALVVVLIGIRFWRLMLAESRAAETSNLACPRCGYDLTGAMRDRCPECGCDVRDRQAEETKVRRRFSAWEYVIAGFILFLVAAAIGAVLWIARYR